tara:strand:+ start:299 stop:1237 length:939 start_codon:yes stop_codon:yes gene_type:complete
MGYKTKSMLHSRTLASVESKTYYGPQGAKDRLTGEVSGPARGQISNNTIPAKQPTGATSKWAEIGTLAGMLINQDRKSSGTTSGSTSNSIGRSTDKFDKKILTAEAKGRVKKAGRLEAREANWDRKQNQGGNTTLNKISSEDKQDHYGGTKGKGGSTFSERRKARLENNRKELTDNQARRSGLSTDTKAKESEKGNTTGNTGNYIQAFKTDGKTNKKKVVSTEVLNKRIKEKQKAEGIVKMNPKGAQRLPSLQNGTGFSKNMQKQQVTEKKENNTVQSKDHSTALQMAQRKWPRKEYISTFKDGMYKYELDK